MHLGACSSYVTKRSSKNLNIRKATTVTYKRTNRNVQTEISLFATKLWARYAHPTMATPYHVLMCSGGNATAMKHTCWAAFLPPFMYDGDPQYEYCLISPNTRSSYTYWKGKIFCKSLCQVEMGLKNVQKTRQRRNNARRTSYI